jgi:hypothetical protein
MSNSQDIREAFTFEFLYLVEDLNPLDKTIAELTELFDQQLGEAKRRWPSINTDEEWSRMQDWLSDRGVTRDQY